MEEVWKDIEGYEGFYQISTIGRVRALDRQYIKKNKDGTERVITCKGGIRAINTYVNGYKYANLNKDGIHRTRLIHRLVAIAFLPNPNDLPEVNHKDEDITNNCVDNLEWCTSKYNANYGTRNERCSNKQQRKSVNQYTKDGTFIKKWDGIKEASRALGIDDAHIIRVCNHRKKNVTAGGYKWEYA